MDTENLESLSFYYKQETNPELFKSELVDGLRVFGVGFF